MSHYAHHATRRAMAIKAVGLLATVCASGCVGLTPLPGPPENLSLKIVRTGNNATDLQFALEATNVGDTPLRIPLVRTQTVMRGTPGTDTLTVEMRSAAIEVSMTIVADGMAWDKSDGIQMSISSRDYLSLFPAEQQDRILTMAPGTPLETGWGSQDQNALLAPGKKWRCPLENVLKGQLRDLPGWPKYKRYRVKTSVRFSNVHLKDMARQSDAPTAGEDCYFKTEVRGEKFIWHAPELLQDNDKPKPEADDEPVAF